MSLLQLPELPSRVEELEKRLAALEGRPPIVPDSIAVPNIYKISPEGKVVQNAGAGLERFEDNFEDEGSLANYEQIFGPEATSTKIGEMVQFLPEGGMEFTGNAAPGYLNLVFKGYRDEAGKPRCMGAIVKLCIEKPILLVSPRVYSVIVKYAGSEHNMMWNLLEWVKSGATEEIIGEMLVYAWFKEKIEVSSPMRGGGYLPHKFYLRGAWDPLMNIMEDEWESDPDAIGLGLNGRVIFPIMSRKDVLGGGGEGEFWERGRGVMNGAADQGIRIYSPKAGEIIKQFTITPLASV